MQKFKISTLIILAGLLIFQWAKADSPLTSTYWADKYKDVSIIAERIKLQEAGNQVLSDKEIDFLLNDKNPLAHRLTLINANGWNINGLNNNEKFLPKLLKKYNVTREDQLLEKANAYDLLVWAYLRAMDNYMDVNIPLGIAFKAFEKHRATSKKSSYAFLLVFVLIKTQSLLGDQNQWCDIYKNYEAVKSLYDEDKLDNDFKTEAVKPIDEYLGLYKESCQ